MQNSQINLFNYSEHIGKNTDMLYYTTYKGLPIYNRDYLLSALIDAAGYDLSRMVSAYFADIEQQANVQLQAEKEDKEEIAIDLDIANTSFNSAFELLETIKAELGDIVCSKRINKDKLAALYEKVCQGYYDLKVD